MKPIKMKKSKFTDCGSKLVKTYRVVEFCGNCRKNIHTKYYKFCPYCGEKIERV